MTLSIGNAVINVKPDGTGDYTTIQAALDSLPLHIHHEYYISIEDGTYNEDIEIPPVFVPRFANGQRAKLIIEGNTADRTKVKVKSVRFGGGVGALSFRGFDITGNGAPLSDGGGTRAMEVGGDITVIIQDLLFSGNPIACISCFGGKIVDKGNVLINGNIDYYVVTKRGGEYNGTYTNINKITGHVNKSVYWTQDPNKVIGFEESGMRATYGTSLFKSSSIAVSYDYTTNNNFTNDVKQYAVTQFVGVVPPVVDPEPGPDPDPVTPSVEAQAIIDAMTVTPDSTRQTLITNLVDSLVTAGVWSKLTAFGVFAAHDKQAGLINWKAPTVSFAESGAISFIVDEGCKSNNGSYIETGELLSSLVAQNDGHLSVYTTEQVAQGNPDLGVSNDFNTFINPLNGANKFQSRLNSSNVSVSHNSSIGHSVLVRDSGNVTAYFSGSQIVSESETALSLGTGTLRLCGGINGSIEGVRRVALFSAGQKLTAQEVADFNMAVDNYLNGVF